MESLLAIVVVLDHAPDHWQSRYRKRMPIRSALRHTTMAARRIPPMVSLNSNLSGMSMDVGTLSCAPVSEILRMVQSVTIEPFA